MDLPGSGERVVSRAVSVVSNVNPAENRIVFVTILPSSDPCDAGGTSWLMELLFTGGQPAAPVFDLNNDGVFDDADKIVVDGNAVPVSGVKSNVGIMATPTWLDKDAEKAFKLVPGTSGGVMTITNKGKGGSGTTTRVYWQQLL
jgi:type IV pilus assembly protein PilY1